MSNTIPAITIPTPTSVQMRDLRVALCGKDKMPANFTYIGPATIKLRSPKCPEVTATVKVVASVPSGRTNFLGRPKKSSKHRIFISWNGRWIPAGRAHQAKA